MKSVCKLQQLGGMQNRKFDKLEDENRSNRTTSYFDVFPLQVIEPEGDWWWAGWSILSCIALILNFIFLVVIVKNR